MADPQVEEVDTAFNNIILNSDVYYLENSKNNKVYIEENLQNLDSYDIYLDGASSYMEIKKK